MEQRGTISAFFPWNLLIQRNGKCFGIGTKRVLAKHFKSIQILKKCSMTFRICSDQKIVQR